MKKIYLITGITGYVGGMLAKYLLGKSEDTKLIAIARNAEKVKEAFDEQQLKRITVVTADITDESVKEKIKKAMKDMNIEKIDYIFHCAATTESAKMIEEPVSVVDGMVLGTINILKAATEIKIKSMVYLSSMEVYGSVKCLENQSISEEMLGDIELFNVRSCYPMGKRMAEHYCFLYFKRYSVPVKIARLAQTFGKSVLSGDNRVYMQFARAALEKRDITLHTTGESYGNYCSIDDTVEGLEYILKYGKDGEAYNLVNEDNTMQIKDMAKLVAEVIAEGQINVVYDIPEEKKYGYAADTQLRMSGEKLEKLGFRPKKSLEEMYRDVIARLEENNITDMINSAKGIVIYGAKAVAYGVYEALKCVYGVIPEYFVISDTTGEKNKTINGVPVIGIDELCVLKDELIIVAVPEIYHEEIGHILEEKSYKNVLYADTHTEYLLMKKYYRKNGSFKLLEDVCSAKEVLCDEKKTGDAGVMMYMAKSHVDKELKHKYSTPEWIIPIQVGAALTNIDLCDLKDDTGENISEKNKNYCELTATYWAWKNSDADYKGVCHYRRNIHIEKKSLEVMVKTGINVVLPLPFVCYPDCSGQYKRYINDKDIEAMMGALNICYPEYAEAATKILKGKYLYNYNMLLADRDTFDKYAEWLFTILEKVEEISEPKADCRSDRYIGYLGEVLTAIYFLYNKDKLKIVHGEKVWMV